MIQLIRKLYTLGETPTLNTFDVCKLQIVNRLVVWCIILDLLLIIANTFFGNYQGIVIDLLAMFLVLIPVLWLNKKESYQAATLIFLIGYHIAVSSGGLHAILQDRPNEIENLLIPGAIAIIILLDKLPQFIGLLLNMSMLIWLNYLRFENSLGDFIKLAVVLVIIYLGIYYFISQFKSQLFETLFKMEKLNHELADKERALTISDKAKNRIFSIVAHDLKSPLSVLQGLLDPEIQQNLKREELIEYQKSVRERVQVLATSMNSLLDWSKSQMENIKAERQKVELQDVLDSVNSFFVDIVKGKSINLDINVENGLSAWIDRQHAEVILRNIIHNAIKFSPIGSSINVRGYRNAHEDCVLEIEDNGPGIDQNKIEAIMAGELIETEPGTEGESGTGIGLNFSLELINMNNGRLEIIPSRQVGSVFKLHFEGIH